MTDESAGAATAEFFGLKSKRYSYLVDDNSDHKKSVSRNVATISHNEYKQFLLKKKCLRHLIDKIERKDHRMGTYEINKISCFDDKIYIQNNGCDGLALGYSC